MYQYFGRVAYLLFECKHVSENKALRFICCRKRQARLLIIDRLIQVLICHRDEGHTRSDNMDQIRMGECTKECEIDFEPEVGQLVPYCKSGYLDK